MKNYKLLFFVGIIFLSACSQKNADKVIVVKNTLNVERIVETVELTRDLLQIEDLSTIGIRDLETNELQLTQTVDNDGDGVLDELLFQPKVGSSSEKKYAIVKITEEERTEVIDCCYSRFVPERTDDYAWENDRVAFRTFGPTAQKMNEEGVYGGTLSSGIDCWLKKVKYPIINKWYAGNVKEAGFYHKDHGEGLDNFHVGTSRGCGGIAVKVDNEYKTSKNFVAHQTWANGVIRTAFVLDYAPWEIGENKTVKTSHSISLDKGSQLSKIEINVIGADMISAGLTLHENDGTVTVDSLGSWVSYWQPHGDFFLGTALVASPGTFLGIERVESEIEDLSHVYMNLAVRKGIAVYYSGFCWTASGQFEVEQDWNRYLSEFSQSLKSPLLVEME